MHIYNPGIETEARLVIILPPAKSYFSSAKLFYNYLLLQSITIGVYNWIPGITRRACPPWWGGIKSGNDRQVRPKLDEITVDRYIHPLRGHKESELMESYVGLRLYSLCKAGAGYQ
jgi:hypothetical protein